MDQWMGAKHREHAHVLLRMVKLVETPEHAHAMVGQMGEPVASVHGNHYQGDHDPFGHDAGARDDDPRRHAARDFGERERQSGPEGNDERGVQERKQDVLSIAASEEGPTLGRAKSFDHQERTKDDERRGSHHHHPQTRHGLGEARAAPLARPTNANERHRDGDDGKRR